MHIVIEGSDTNKSYTAYYMLIPFPSSHSALPSTPHFPTSTDVLRASSLSRVDFPLAMFPSTAIWGEGGGGGREEGEGGEGGRGGRKEREGRGGGEG